MHQHSSMYFVSLMIQLYNQISKLFLQNTLPGQSTTTRVNAEIQKMCDWLAVNKLSLNALKTRMMSFKFHQRTNIATPIPEVVRPEAFSEPHNLIINGAIIKKVPTFNFLGIIINENLTWDSHTTHLRTKIISDYGVWTGSAPNTFHTIISTIISS